MHAVQRGVEDSGLDGPRWGHQAGLQHGRGADEAAAFGGAGRLQFGSADVLVPQHDNHRILWRPPEAEGGGVSPRPLGEPDACSIQTAKFSEARWGNTRYIGQVEWRDMMRQEE